MHSAFFRRFPGGTAPAALLVANLHWPRWLGASVRRHAGFFMQTPPLTCGCGGCTPLGAATAVEPAHGAAVFPGGRDAVGSVLSAIC